MNTAAAAVLDVAQLSVCLHASVERQGRNVSQALLGCFLAVNAELGQVTQDLVIFGGLFPGLYDAMQRNGEHQHTGMCWKHTCNVVFNCVNASDCMSGSLVGKEKYSG